MRDTFIIEEIKRREREADSHRERPRIHRELPQRPPQQERAPESNEDADRGVVIIDYSIQGYGF